METRQFPGCNNVLCNKLTLKLDPVFDKHQHTKMHLKTQPCYKTTMFFKKAVNLVSTLIIWYVTTVLTRRRF